MPAIFSLLVSGVAVLLSSSIRLVDAQYTLVQQYDYANFFDEFTFYTAADPTEGYVEYVSESVAEDAGLAKITNNQVYLGVDHVTVNPSGGRESVRLTSNTAYSKSSSPPFSSPLMPSGKKEKTRRQDKAPF